METSKSIKVLLKQATQKLNNVSDSAYLDSELLLSHCLGKNRSYLHTWPEKELTKEQLTQFESLIEKRSTDYPVAYLLGKKAFWTLDLIVTPDVLIPRPETELLVEIALEKIINIKNPIILDLGTGSGAIALALAYERPDAIIIATDFSEKALDIARANSTELNLDMNITFLQSFWFDDLNVNDDYFDLILSNPPYIDSDDDHLKETIRYEPQQALIAKDKGMCDIEQIIKKSHPFLKKGGWLILEHGFDQAKKMINLLNINHFLEVKNNKDLNHNFRVTLGLKK